MKKLKIIHAPVMYADENPYLMDEAKFTKLVNEFLEEHDKAEVSFPEKETAYIVYDEYDDTKRMEYIERRYGKPSETPVTDEFAKEGIRYLCKECPYLEVGQDKRRKVWPCKYATYGMSRTESNCCEMFYKKLKQGEITPISEEADND